MNETVNRKFTIEDATRFHTMGDISIFNGEVAYCLNHYRKDFYCTDVYYNGKRYKDAKLPKLENGSLFYLKNTVEKKAPLDIPYYLKEQHFIRNGLYQNNQLLSSANLDVLDYKVNESDYMFVAWFYEEVIPLKDYSNYPLVFDSPSFYNDKEYGFKAKRKKVLYLNDKEIHFNGAIHDYLLLKQQYLLVYTFQNEFFIELFDFHQHSLLKINLSQYSMKPSYTGFSVLYYEKENAVILAMNHAKDSYNDPKNLYLIKLEKDSEPIPLINMKYLMDGAEEEAYNLNTKPIVNKNSVIYKNELYFISAYNGTNSLYKVPIQKNSKPLLLDNKRNYSSIFTDEEQLYATVSTHDCHSLLINAITQKKLLDPNPKYKNKVYADFKVINTKGRNNNQLQGNFYLPETIQEKLPLIVVIHGGPNGFYSTGFNYEAELYASKGYAVLLPNPRGGSGFGKKHGNMNYAFSKEAMEDIEDLITSLIKEYPFIDQKRIGITGGSYGGYETIYATIHSDLFKAAVSLRPLISFQMTGSCSSSAGSDPSDPNKPFSAYLKNYLKCNLSTYVEKIHIPLEIIHSSLDANCLPEASMQLIALLDFYHPDLPKRLCLYPLSNHGLLSYGPAHLVEKAYEDILDWFDHYLI